MNCKYCVCVCVSLLGGVGGGALTSLLRLGGNHKACDLGMAFVLHSSVFILTIILCNVNDRNQNLK